MNMTALAIFVGLSLVSIGLAFWAQKKMNAAMKVLFSVAGYTQNQGVQMGCKCQEKKLKTPEGSLAPCADLNEESYRDAFLRESKKLSKMAAEKQYLQTQLSHYETQIKGMAKRLDTYMDQLEAYAESAYEALPPDIQGPFKEKYGVAPKRLKVGHGS